MSVSSGGAEPATPRFPSRSQHQTKCSNCGATILNQLPQQTQLDSTYFVPKTHPRIRLRGHIDSLHAISQMVAHQYIPGPNAEWIQAALDDLIDYVKELGSAEFHLRRAQSIHVNGLSGETINELSHHPEGLRLDHSFLGPGSPDATHWSNMARTAARAAELDAWHHVRHPEDEVFTSIALGFNLMSSAFYYLELLSATNVRIDHAQ